MVQEKNVRIIHTGDWHMNHKLSRQRHDETVARDGN